jgi:competence protein ComEA
MLRILRMLLSIVTLSVCAIAHAGAAGAAQAPSGNRAPVNSVNSVNSVKSVKGDVPASVNINTASVKELDALPGIGTKTAALIVEYRQKNGPFKKIEELMNVRGVGEKSFLKLKPQLTVAAVATTSKAERPKQ